MCLYWEAGGGGAMFDGQIVYTLILCVLMSIVFSDEMYVAK